MEKNKTLDIMLHGKSIRFFRSLKGVSCRELAEISGVKQSSLHKFETGRRRITKLANFRIIRALQSMHLDLDEILVINLYVVQKHGGITSNE
ncbi:MULTISPECIES: helix-turn-helix transcriptional regulator [unclassified Bacillus cereus group]|uniref:helix-turn-helix domain-containing protein n=1 Tax=unclassified Bacillus cereus group TaxID=2750818 RepID=UPI0024C6F26F|nr:MAG: helix-turn-helix transcriptional regulator [Bacillus paranthracis]WAI34418.1 MAG: helix-turn-helix transcriptional regulator [Bacillus paranthracis]WAI37457.1 MAG: helix-turn-helix transcriptional regulator [Bacillus paranthracis]